MCINIVTIELEDVVVEYEESPEIHKRVFDSVVEFCKKYEAFNGESMCQSDDPSIEAVYHLADIVDNIIKFELTWKGE